MAEYREMLDTLGGDVREHLAMAASLLAARGFALTVVEMPDSTRTSEEAAAAFGLPALPVEFGPDRTRPGLTRQPPRMGEHSAELLAEAGYGTAEIASLTERGVIVHTGVRRTSKPAVASPILRLKSA